MGSDPGIFRLSVYNVLVAFLMRELDQLCDSSQLTNLLSMVLKV